MTNAPCQPTSPRVQKARATLLVTIAEQRGDILPRFIYEQAEVDVPPEATDELQPNRKRPKRRR